MANRRIIKPTIKTLLKWLLYIQCLCGGNLFANPTLNDTATNAQVAAQLEGPGVTISNFSVVTGTAQQFGIFTGGSSSATPGPQINIDEGVFMTTSSASATGVANYEGGTGPTFNAARGPNDAGGISGEVGLTYSDPQLTSIDSGAIFDPIILQMQAVTTGSYLKVSFVFASDEYPEFVCSVFNDPFGMFIKPASLPDTPANWKNIGVIPGTSTPIAVNTINSGVCGAYADGTPTTLTNSQYYVDNGTGLTPANNTNLQYDGMTIPFTVETPVTSGVTYDVKIAIADAGDAAWDGALFLKWLSSSNFSADADLELGLQADNTSPNVGDTVVFTLTVDNKGQDAAAGIQASFPLPTGFTHVSDTSGGNYNPATGIWTIPGSLAAMTGSTSIQITTTANNNGSVNAFAEIATVNASDVDSIPGNSAQSPAEDDEATVSLTVQINPADFQCSAKVDVWYANNESDSVSPAEFTDALDFIYQVTDGFYHSFASGAQGGIVGWAYGSAPVNVIVPITESFNDFNDSGLASTGVITDGDGAGVRENYTVKVDTTGGTHLHNATQGLADLINAGNGRRTGVPQVAVFLTDAPDFQINNVAGNGGGSAWEAAAANLRAAGPDGTRIALVLLAEAADAYDNNATARATIDKVVGSNGIVIQTSTYAAAANAANGYIDQTINSICAVADFAPDQDYGDAPVSGTAPNGSDTNSYGAASHTIVSGTYLGAADPDAEGANLPTANADGDDTDGTNDDDGIALPLLVQNRSGTLTATVAGTGGFLQGWIDFNGNGAFDTDEQIAIDYQDGGTGDTDGAADGTITFDSSVPATATTTQTFARFRWSTTSGLDSTTAASDGEVEDYALTVFAADYGDAPANMSAIDDDLSNTYGEAMHIIDEATYLGNNVDAETSSQNAGLNADGDDNDGTDDDDGVTFPLTGTLAVLRADQANTITVNTSTNGFLNAWIDWNQDGDWADVGETIVTNQNMTAGDNPLNLTPAITIPQGATYMRFRFTSTAVTSPSPYGTLPDGEVEDYRVNIIIPTPVEICATATFNEGFELAPHPSSYFIRPEDQIQGWATVPDSPTSGASYAQRNGIEIWRSGYGGVSAFEGSYFAELNAYVPGMLYQDVELSPGSSYTWSFAHRGRSGTDTLNVLMGTPGAEVSQGIFSTDASGWKIYSGIYTVPAGQYITRFGFQAVGSSSIGNFIDAIQIPGGCDFGDAPDSYGTRLSSNGAHHVSTSLLHLGPNPGDPETDGYDSATADGDDSMIADEDGVRFNGTTLQGQTLDNDSAINLTVTTNGLGRLHGWIDWDRDGVFGNNINERIVSENSSASGTRSISVTPPNDLTPGISYARFRYATDNAAASPTGLATDGEVEDYLVILSRGFTVSGRVFNDRNVNMTNDTNEPGIGDIAMVLYDSNNATCSSTRTNANGDYQFSNVAAGDYQVYEAAGESVPTPQNCGPTNLSDPAGYLSTTASDSVVFTVSNGDTSGINFGDIKPPLFELDNTQTILPNSAALHPHVFTAQADGSVSFSVAAENADPATLNWGRQLLLDNNCDGQLDSDDSALPATINLSAGQRVCILNKVISPANAPANALHTMNVQSDFSYGNGSILPNDQQLQRDTTRTLAGTTTAPPVDPTVDPVGNPDPIAGEGKLSLVKSVWNVTRDIEGNVALPGETLRYSIHYENVGNGPLNELMIQDSVPAFTTLIPASMLCTDTPTELPSCAANDSADGSLSWEWTVNDKLNSGSKGSVSYEVVIE